MINKVHINRLRRAACRQGYRLRKSRTRDPRAVTFNHFAILTERGSAVVMAVGLETVEKFLVGGNVS
jgi:hypothetical protein